VHFHFELNVVLPRAFASLEEGEKVFGMRTEWREMGDARRRQRHEKTKQTKRTFTSSCHLLFPPSNLLNKLRPKVMGKKKNSGNDSQKKLKGVS